MTFKPNIPQRLVLLIASAGLFFAAAVVFNGTLRLHDGVLMSVGRQEPPYLPVLLMLLSAILLLLAALHNLPSRKGAASCPPRSTP